MLAIGLFLLRRVSHPGGGQDWVFLPCMRNDDIVERRIGPPKSGEPDFNDHDCVRIQDAQLQRAMIQPVEGVALPNFWVEPQLFPSTLGSTNQIWRALVIQIGPSTPVLAARRRGDVSPDVCLEPHNDNTSCTARLNRPSRTPELDLFYFLSMHGLHIPSS